MSKLENELKRKGVTTKSFNAEKSGFYMSPKEMRQEASRLASMANKRLQRLENKGLQSSPAYKKWIDEGGQKFGVKGKTNNEVQSELARLRKFINAETSTIRGTTKVLKEMAENTGIATSGDITKLHQQAENFFELASKVEQYLRTVDDMASAIGYQQIWEAINIYVKESNIDLSSAELPIEEMTSFVADLAKKESENKIVYYDGLLSDTWAVID